jgi:XTP/dITP diphosphohydrolase
LEIERVEILLATTNPGKVREFSDLLGSEKIVWRTLSDFPGITTIDETGSTFRANAILKAGGYAKATNRWTLADDSGLEVDALSGQPGIHSARWAQQHHAGSGDSANNDLLLKQLQSTPDDLRGGRFVCVLALADPAGRIILTARDTVAGRILRAAVGGGGFGYDPLFYIDALQKTTAQLPPHEKHQISHRGKALRRLKKLMDRIDLENVVKGSV